MSRILHFFLIITLSILVANHSLSQTIQSFFNSPEFGDDIKSIIINYINQSQSNISISAYSFDDPDITSALINANNRGVKIRIIVDSDYWNTKLDLLDSLENINVFNDLKSKGFKQNPRQHHSKFLVIDYDTSSSPVNNTVITGSFNFTQSASLFQYNNIVVVKNNIDIANIYIQEFNEEWGSSGFNFNPLESRMGKQKKDPPPYLHSTENIEVYFSYSDRNKIKDRMIQLISEASNIFFCIYSFSTNSELFNIIYELTDTRDVYGVFDWGHAFGQYSAFRYFQSKKPDNFVLDQEYKILHNKYMILNYYEDDPSKAIVITGSYNFSKNAEENNEENIIVIKNNPTIARRYIKDFLYHFSRSGKSVDKLSPTTFFKTNIVSQAFETNRLEGRNLQRVVSLIASNQDIYTSLTIISNLTNAIYFTVPDIPGVFNIISVFNDTTRELTPVSLTIYSSNQPLLVINDNRKYIRLDEIVDVRLYTPLEQELTYITLSTGNETRYITLYKEGNVFRARFYLDNMLRNISNNSPLIFSYSNLYITNFVVLPPFSYKIHKPEKFFKNSFHTVRFEVKSDYGRKIRLSVVGNIPTTVSSDGTVSFYTGNEDKIELLFTIEDELGNSFSEVLEITTQRRDEIVVYPTFANKGDKIFIEGDYDNIEILDKDYNRIPFSLGQEENGRKYLIPQIYKNSSILFIVFRKGDKNIVRKVVVK